MYCQKPHALQNQRRCERYHDQKREDYIYMEKLNHTATNLENLAHKCGFKVTAILDGNICPNCKCNTWKRNKEVHLVKNYVFYCRQNVIYLVSKWSTNPLSSADKERLFLFNKEEKSLKNQAFKTILLSTFKSDLED